MNNKTLAGIISLIAAFTLISYSLPKAPKHITLPIGSIVLLLFGYYEGIKKLEKTGNPVKLFKELGCTTLFILGAIVMIYGYIKIYPVWMMGLIPGAFFFYLSRKWFLSPQTEEEKEKLKEEEDNSKSSKQYAKENAIPIGFLILFIASFMYSDNQLLLKLEGVAFITAIIINRLHWT